MYMEGYYVPEEVGGSYKIQSELKVSLDFQFSSVFGTLGCIPSLMLRRRTAVYLQGLRRPLSG